MMEKIKKNFKKYIDLMMTVVIAAFLFHESATEVVKTIYICSLIVLVVVDLSIKKELKDGKEKN